MGGGRKRTAMGKKALARRGQEGGKRRWRKARTGKATSVTEKERKRKRETRGVKWDRDDGNASRRR